MGNAPRCPRCGSSNTRKSDNRLLKGGLAHIGEFALGYGLGWLGLEDVAKENANDLAFSQYLDDEFQCKDCGYVWKPGQSSTYIPQNQSGNSQIGYAHEEITNQENQLFSDEFNSFFENEKSILLSSDSLRNYMNKIDGIIKNQITDTIVKSEYRFLQAFACSEYLYYIDASDVGLAKIGERKVDSAIQYLNDDEYKVLKRVLHSYNLDFGASDILSIQKTYDQKCPNIQSLQNTLIKTEYLEQIYNFSRFSSIYTTALKLDERGLYKQALDALKLLLELDTPLAYITASAHLYYCHFIEKDYKQFWDEDKAFRYAKQGADYAIEFMKSNYDAGDSLCKKWMTLVGETALRYQLGIGIEVNISEAERYLMIGVGHGDEECKKLLKELYESPSTNVANSTDGGKETGYSADGVSADIMNIVNNNKWYFRELTQKYDLCFFLMGKKAFSDFEKGVKSILDTFPLGKEEIPLYLCGYFYNGSSNSYWFLITDSSIYCDYYDELVFDWNAIVNITIEKNKLCIFFERKNVSYKWELAPEWLTGDPNAPLEQWRNILQLFVEAGKSNIQKNNGYQTGLTDSEQEYLDTLKESFEDGDLSPRERKMLERIRVSLGISDERAKEIEASLSSPKLTEGEQAYLDAYKEATIDGKISEKERRLLEKLRVLYNISENRAREIESMQ